MSRTKNLKKVKIDGVQIGMFITKLDIPWIDSPFIKNSVLIKSAADIEKLRKAGVKIVLIDLSKSKLANDKEVSSEPATKEEITAPEDGPQTKSPGSASDTAATAQALATEQNTNPSKTKKVSLADELDAAQNIRDRIQSTLNTMMKSLESKQAIDTAILAPIVDDTLASLARNNQALLNIAHLSRRSAKIADHVASTLCLALNVAQIKSIDSQEMQALGFATLLHEAGWIQIPLDLMGKRTPYSDVEKKLIQRHIEVGLGFLKQSHIPELSLRIIKEHHEHCDGSGYPAGLTREKLHPLSRLLRVVDSYDERIHHLLDKPSVLPTNALRALYVEAERGAYDKEAVSMLIASLGIYPVSSGVLLNTGERALVLEVPADNHLKPIIQIHYDEHNRALSTPIIVDLGEQNDSQPTRHIDSVLDPNNPLHDPSRKLRLDIH